MVVKNKFMLGFDKWWLVERDLWNNLVGQEGEHAVESMLLSALPNLGSDILPSVSLSLIGAGSI
jgi:hypothetical protein